MNEINANADYADAMQTMQTLREFGRKAIASGEVACGFEPSLVKYHRIYLLPNGRDALNWSAFCVNQDNDTHTITSLTKLFVLTVVSVLAMEHILDS